MIEGSFDCLQLFIVNEGRFKWTVKDGDSDPPIIFTEGHSFGGLALLYQVPAFATVTSVDEGVLWVIDRATFLQL